MAHDGKIPAVRNMGIKMSGAMPAKNQAGTADVPGGELAEARISRA
jgi:hypothetical protein